MSTCPGRGDLAYHPAHRPLRIGSGAVTAPPAAYVPRKPTPAELAAAAGKGIRDVIAPNLRVLFVGINPSLYTAATGYHFGRPGNRFWPALHAGGFTQRLLHPSEQRQLLGSGYGITNVVNRATARAEELGPEEFVAGGKRLVRKIERYRPRAVAFLGVGAYRAAFALPKARIGGQPEPIAGAAVWVLPNPSGLNANYQLAALAKLFRQVRLDSESHAERVPIPG